jgi:hypothetical protein
VSDSARNVVALGATANVELFAAEGPMTIHRLLQNTPLEPEEIERLVAAYGRTLRALALTERDDPLTQAVAKKIIEIGQSGIRDPEQISELALRAFRAL